MINETLAAVRHQGTGLADRSALALISVALVDVWKGVGLATVIYIAGIASISRDYYEAAIIDGANGAQNFWNITLPLVRPATVTVIILSLIGGLRSFDLIWAMTRGGPGFTSDVIASVIYKQYQAGFYGPLDGRQRRALRRRRDHHRAAVVVAQPQARSSDEARARRYWIGGAAIVVSIVVFIVPFVFIILMAVKDRKEASLRDFSLPVNGFHLWDNLVEVIADARLHAGHGLHQLDHPDRRQRNPAGDLRRHGRLRAAAPAVALDAGRQLPGARRPDHPAGSRPDDLGAAGPQPVQDPARPDPDRGRLRAVVHVLLFRAFVATIPRELDEAAIMDGAGPLRVFFQVMLPLLRPVVVTVIVVQSVAIFNDFTNPLYYLPGKDNVTVQLTLYNFQSQFSTSYNLLFMNILLITIPPLIVFLFFNRQIVAGMTAGAVKG